MKRMFAMFAILGLLTVPVLVSADETIIPPEANWSAVPATPPLVATPQKREAVTPQVQESVRPTPRRTPARASFGAFQDNALSQIADDNDE